MRSRMFGTRDGGMLEFIVRGCQTNPVDRLSRPRVLTSSEPAHRHTAPTSPRLPAATSNGIKRLIADHADMIVTRDKVERADICLPGWGRGAVVGICLSGLGLHRGPGLLGMGIL